MLSHDWKLGFLELYFSIKTRGTRNTNAKEQQIRVAALCNIAKPVATCKRELGMITQRVIKLLYVLPILVKQYRLYRPSLNLHYQFFVTKLLYSLTQNFIQKPKQIQFFELFLFYNLSDKVHVVFSIICHFSLIKSNCGKLASKIRNFLS